MIRRTLLALAGAAIALALYGALYVGTVYRSSSRARGAGGFFHYREVAADWQVYPWVPAAFVESRLIHICPKPFVPHPSWAQGPQLLILRSPNHVIQFHASAKRFSTD